MSNITSDPTFWSALVGAVVWFLQAYLTPKADKLPPTTRTNRLVRKAHGLNNGPKRKLRQAGDEP